MQLIYRDTNIIKTRIKKMKEIGVNSFIINDKALKYLNINNVLFNIMKEYSDKNTFIDGIERLDLSNSLIDGVMEWNLLSNFKDLKQLSLHNNKFTSHNDEINWNLLPDSLEILDLSKNMNLKGKIIWNELPKNLQVLDISETKIICEITEIDWIEIDKTNLIDICVSYDKFNQIPPSFLNDPLPLNWSRKMVKNNICFVKDYKVI